MRTAVLAASLLILSACTTPSLPAPDLTPPAPKAPDPRLCLPAKPEPKPRGTIIQPVTEEERLATGAHLESDAEARDWGRQGWDLAGVARRALCPPPDG